ncbi:MAG TPA: DUF5994 family protein [Streptosporangiaceae bacterium]|nr:DUF5994 family protein [Streptosporangiaceae bacterium]
MNTTAADSGPAVMPRNAAAETIPASPAPPVPRLRLGAALSRGTLLDGAWWPRSADPAAELPALITALEGRCGRVTRLMLGPAGWDSQPRRLAAAGRVVKPVMRAEN